MRRWMGWVYYLCILGLFVFQTASLSAGEHPGGTMEHPGEEQVEEEEAEAEEGEAEEGEADVTGTQEQPGETQEPPGETQEQPGTTRLDNGVGEILLAKATAGVPSPNEIRSAMDEYAKNDSRLKGGFFLLYDPKVDQVLSLEFVRVHERVGKLRTREGYFSCCDFKDAQNGKMYDVDFWMNDDLEITDVMVHKVDGKPRFTYDENDNMIQLN